MISDTFVSAIMTASVTGAGLVIAFYAFIASMSSRIFERRAEKLGAKHDEIKKIREDPQAFKSTRLEETTKKLKALSDDVKEISTFPQYLGYFVFFDFVLFSLSALLAFNWLSIQEASRTDSQWLLLAGTFFFAICLFFIVGGSGILEVYRTMKDRFEKLKEDKDDAQRDARSIGPVQHPI